MSAPAVPVDGRVRVALVMPHGQIAGAERVLLELLAATPPGAVVVCVPRDSALAEAVTGLGHRVRDFSLPKLADTGPWRYPAAYAKALRTLRRVVLDEEVEVIHGFVAFTIKVVVPVARITSTPALVSVHEMTAPESIGRFRSLLQRRLASGTALRITAVSHAVATVLLSTGYPPERVVVVHNGIDRSTPRTERALARKSLGIADHDLVFLVAGRLTRWKGQMVATEAFERFCKNHSDLDARLLIVGGPFQKGDLAYEAELARRIAESAVSERIETYGYRSDVDLFYDAADVVLVPSTEPEPLGMVVLEAGLAERPVLVTDLGGAPETVVDTVTGLVVSPTVECFEMAMARATDRAWREQAGRAGRSHVEEHFSRARFAQRMVEEWTATARNEREVTGVRHDAD